jgi:hypothetical protein
VTQACEANLGKLAIPGLPPVTHSEADSTPFTLSSTFADVRRCERNVLFLSASTNGMISSKTDRVKYYKCLKQLSLCNHSQLTISVELR